MKLVKFGAKGVFGELNFEVSFFENVNFLVGINGSGKTTVLNIIEAMLANDINILEGMNIEHSYIVFTQKIERTLVWKKKQKSIDIFEGKEKVSTYSPPRINTRRPSRRMIGRRLVFDDREYIDNDSTNIFVGLNRRANFSSYDELKEISNMIHYSDGDDFDSIRGMKNFKFDFAIRELKRTIGYKYKNMMAQETAAANDTRKSIVSELFKISKPDDAVATINIKNAINKIENKKTNIITALDRADMLTDESKHQVLEYISSITKTISAFEKSKHKDNEIIYAFLYKTESMKIDALLKIISIIEDNNARSEKIFKPITDFINSVNEFFKDTGKNLIVTQEGDIFFKNPKDDKCEIEKLSSGERQILLLFYNLHFKGRKDKIVFIDEPEISLHILWQSKFIEEVVKSIPNSQLIVATHSPEIISEYSDFCIEISGDN